MGAFNPFLAIRRSLKSDLGSIAQFYRRILIPQIFLFVVLLLLGSIVGERVLGVMQKCCIILYLLTVALVCRVYLERITTRLFLVHQFALFLLIAITGQALQTDHFSTVLLPQAILVVLYAWLPVPTISMLLIACASVVSLGVTLGLNLAVGLLNLQPSLTQQDPLLSLDSTSGVTLEFYIGLVSIAVYMVLALIHRLHAPSDFASGGSDQASTLSGYARQPVRRGYGAKEDLHRTRNKDNQSAQQSLVHSLRMEYLLRALFGMLGALGLAGYISATGEWQWGLAQTIIALLAQCVLFALLVKLLWRSRRVREQALVALACVFLVFSVLALALVSCAQFAIAELVVGSIVIIIVSSFPLQRNYHLSVYVLSLACILLGVSYQIFTIEAGGIFAVVASIGLILGRNAFCKVAFQSGVRAISQTGRWLPTVQAMARESAWHLRAICEASKALVLIAERRYDGFTLKLAESIGESQNLPSDEDPIFAKGLLQFLDDKLIREFPSSSGGADSGFHLSVVRVSELGEQFILPLVSWFGASPSRLLVLRMRTPGQTGEELFYLVVPLPSQLLELGAVFRLESVMRKVEDLCSVVNLYFVSALLKVVKDDELLAIQQLASQRDEELSQVVHLVNNSVQELVLLGDNLLACLAENPLGSSNVELARSKVGQISGAVLVLGLAVSDVRLIRELVSLSERDELDTIDPEELLAQVVPFADYLARRKAAKFEVQQELESGKVLQVINGDLAGTVLRAVVELTFSRIQRAGQVKVNLKQTGDYVALSIEDDAVSGYADLFGLDNAASSANMVHDSTQGVRVDGIKRFIELSRGSLEIARDASLLPNKLTIMLRVQEQSRTATARPTTKRWVLLVEDSEEIRAFYSRVAEALELEYVVASSLTEAKLKVAQHGKPSLIITDVQLGDGSGVELLSEVYRQFGNQIPVIVVSGEAGSVGEEVRKIENATGTESKVRFLTKPVGRKKLFDEIAKLLKEVK